MTATAEHRPIGRCRCSCGWEGDYLRVHMADVAHVADVDRLRAERDQARSIACRLEQELAATTADNQRLLRVVADYRASECPNCDERLRVNVGLIAENTELKRKAGTTATAAVHWALVRNELWTPYCSTEPGWSAPLAKVEEQVTCPVCCAWIARSNALAESLGPVAVVSSAASSTGDTTAAGER